ADAVEGSARWARLVGGYPWRQGKRWPPRLRFQRLRAGGRRGGIQGRTGWGRRIAARQSLPGGARELEKRSPCFRRTRRSTGRTQGPRQQRGGLRPGCDEADAQGEGGLDRSWPLYEGRINERQQGGVQQ